MDVRVDCTPDEGRRLLGQPALLPLYEAMTIAWERWMMALVASSPLPPDSPALAPAPPSLRRRQTGPL